MPTLMHLPPLVAAVLSPSWEKASVRSVSALQQNEQLAVH